MRSRPILTPIAALLMVGASLWQAGGLPPATTHAQATGWVSRAPMPIARAAGAAVTGNDGRIYVFGGSNGAVNFSSAVVYSPTGNRWTPIAPLPVPLSFMGGALGKDGKIYLIGGWDGASSRNFVMAYDPASNTYACSFAGPGCTTSSLAPLPTARSNLGVAAGTDGLIYAVGGFTTQPVATVEAYDPAANVWHEATPLPHATAGPGVSVNPDGGLVVSGGFDGQSYLNTVYIGHRSTSAGISSYSKLHRRPAQGEGVIVLWLVLEAQRLDAAAETKKDAATVTMLHFAIGWLAVLAESSQPPPAAPFAVRILAAAGAANSPDYVTIDLALGGDTGGAASDSVTIIDPASGNRYVGNPMPTARTRAMAAVGQDGTIYIMGGDDGNPLHPYTSMDAWIPPPAPSPTATPAPTATSIPTPTSTPSPTNTAIPLTVRVRLGHKSVKAGRQQSVHVQTQAGASVRITVKFPSGRTLHHTSTAGATGAATWSFTEPAGVDRGKNHTATVTVRATDAAGQSASSTARYSG